MLTVLRISVLACVVTLFSAQAAIAEVYKCTGADGKVSYVEAPCTGAGAKETQVNIVPPAPTDAVSAPATDWKSINAAATARGVAAATTSQRRSVTLIGPMNGGVAKSGIATPKSTQQIVAECEASHGSRCNTAQEIIQRRNDDRTLTAEEEKQRQAALAARRYREQQMEDARYR